MFLKTKNVRSWYSRNGQHAQGLFLVLMQPEGKYVNGNNLRALVRSVRLDQCGHFMMGDLKIGSHKIILSGSYGSDGLPTTVPLEIWEHGVPLPDSLYEKWNKGGGWNSAGTEAEEMRRWALENLSALRKPFREKI